MSRSAEATRALMAGIADIVESELPVGDIIIAASIEVGNLINDPDQHRSNAADIIAKAHGSANVAPVGWNIRGEHLDPLTVGTTGVLQESADLSGRASYNIKINQTTLTTLCKNDPTDLLSIVVPGIVGDLRNVARELRS